MTTDNNVLEVHANIIETFRIQGVEVYFAIVGGSHQCCLAFDNRVLFEDTEVDALHGRLAAWCRDLDKNELGRFIAPF